MQRFCHGTNPKDNTRRCSFTWMENKDWKYFTVDGVKLSRKEYLAFEAKLRSISIEGVPFPDPDHGNADL